MTDAKRVAAHEAGHAVAAVLLGVPVLLIDVVGDATASGRVRHGLEQVSDSEDARKRMLLILAGPIMAAQSWDEVPDWPLETHRSTDERNLAMLAGYLGLDEAGYRELFLEALKLTLTDEFCHLHRAVSGCLDFTTRIGPELLEQLQDIADSHARRAP